MALKVQKIPGDLPKGWERDVVFFANILSLFYGNQSETKVLREKVGTLESYGGRLVPILNLLYSGSNNLLVLERAPDRELMHYFEGFWLVFGEKLFQNYFCLCF